MDADATIGVHAIGATELLVLLAALTVLCLTALSRAWRSAPIVFLVLLGVAAGGAAFFSLGQFDALDVVLLGIDIPDVLFAICSAIGAALVVAGVCLGVFGSATPSEEDVSSALRARDLRQKCRRKMKLFRAMAVAGIPGIGQLAESTSPPFHKSFLVVDLLDAKKRGVVRIQFDLYGVDDERRPRVRGHPAASSGPDPEGTRGSFLVDRLVVNVPTS